MAEVLLINPRRRRAKKRHANPKRRRRVRRNPLFAAMPKRKRRHRRARRSNPSLFRRASRRIRRHARRARRSNPISIRGLFGGVLPMVKNAAIGAAGAIAVDFAYAKLVSFVPATMQQYVKSVPGSVGVADAVKVLTTVAMGRGLSRFTRGLSERAAQGALTVQVDRIARAMLPATITSQLAYAVPAAVVPGTPRVGPTNFIGSGMGAYLAPGSPTALLNRAIKGVGAYSGGASPLLNGRRSMRDRENLVR